MTERLFTKIILVCFCKSYINAEYYGNGNKPH